VDIIPATFANSLETGDFDPLVALYAPDAFLDASLPGLRVRLNGPAAICDRFREWWPTGGRLLRWQTTVFPAGATIEFERSSLPPQGATLCRQRHFLQTRNGRIVRHQLYCARPQSSPVVASESAVVAEVLAGLSSEVVSREPLVHSGQSGNTLERLVLADGRSLVAKQVRARGDWISRATRDRCREAMLCEASVLERLPAELDPAIIVAERQGSESVLVMRDVSDVLLPPERMLTRAESRRILAAAGAMHQKFAAEPIAGLCTLADRLTLMAPVILTKEFDDCDFLPKMLTVGWEVFAEAVPADVVEAIFAVHARPEALAGTLADFGTTLAHGDLRGANIGLSPSRIVLLDWGLAVNAPAAVDFAWYLFVNGWRIEATHEQLIEDFRAACGPLDDERALELGLVAGLAFHGALLAHDASSTGGRPVSDAPSSAGRRDGERARRVRGLRGPRLEPKGEGGALRRVRRVHYSSGRRDLAGRRVGRSRHAATRRRHRPRLRRRRRGSPRRERDRGRHLRRHARAGKTLQP
jgi:Phosphotransferase enzyme family